MLLKLMLQSIYNAVSATEGYKTYAAAAGMLGLSVYRFTTGDIDGMLYMLSMALGIFGIGHKIEKLRSDNASPLPVPEQPGFVEGPKSGS